MLQKRMPSPMFSLCMYPGRLGSFSVIMIEPANVFWLRFWGALDGRVACWRLFQWQMPACRLDLLCCHLLSNGALGLLSCQC
jgi:hypothetical protein